MKKAIIIVFILISLTSKSQIPDQVKLGIEQFLTLNNPLKYVDTSTSLDGRYHILQLGMMDSIVIYKFGFNYEHIGRHYILINDTRRNSFIMFGTSEAIDELSKLRKFFSNHPNFEPSIILDCYNFIILNHAFKR